MVCYYKCTNRYRRTQESSTLIGTAAFYASVIGAFGLIGFGCGKIAEEPDSKVESFVNDAGCIEAEVTDVDIIGVQLRGCGEGDLIAYDVDAVSATTGNEVNLKVCDGIFKVMTIRNNG